MKYSNYEKRVNKINSNDFDVMTIIYEALTKRFHVWMGREWVSVFSLDELEGY